MTTKTQARALERLERERSIPLERYQEDGCESREEYLRDIADQYGISLDTVITLADILGGGEDFDGLISMAEDAETVEAYRG